MIKEIVAIALISNILLSGPIFGPLNLNLGNSISDATIKVTKDIEAEYKSIDFYGVKGSQLKISVSCKKLVFKSDKAKKFDIFVSNANSMQGVYHKEINKSSFELDLSGSLKVNSVYELNIFYELDGVSYRQNDIYICTNKSKGLSFAKSPFYDFNVERTSELWTDEQSLNDLIKPQNDIQSDDPEIIELAQSITGGCSNRYDEVRAIYEYIVSTYYYDDVQIDGKKVYQDDALSLTRRGIAICEGYANVFTALCRAKGIPATVEFGIGKDSYTVFTDKDLQNDEVPNHAWAAVFIDGKWLFVDPTYDNKNKFSGTSIESGKYQSGEHTYNNFLMTLETFSMCHKICDADTVHSIESQGSCGKTAEYKVTRDGTLTISGSGEICLPEGLNGFSKLEFAKDSDITVIGEDCFRDCDLVEKIVLPNTVKEIKKGAFKTCEDLEYVYLPEGLERIGKQAFDYCDELSYVYVPDSVKSIDAFAFDDCPRLYLSVPGKFNGIEKEYENAPFCVEVR